MECLVKSYKREKMTNTLFADILKSYDNLNHIEFKVNDNTHKFYYKYLTILEHTRIKMACTKETITIKPDGSKEKREEEQEHLYPIYCILEKALDENGKKLYSLTDRKAFETISKLPFQLLSYISAEIAFDITGNINALNKAEDGE